jgi:hypothetical protein
MSDQDQTPATPSDPTPLTDQSATAQEGERAGPRTVRIRPWPKTIMMMPTFAAAIACMVIMLLWRPSLEDEMAKLKADAATSTAPAAAPAENAPEGADSQKADTQETQKPIKLGLYRNLGLIFMCVFAVNMLIIFYDVQTTGGFVILATALALVFLFMLLNNHMAILPFLRDALYFLAPIMDLKFYLFVILILGILFFIAFISTRLYYWEIRPNEVIIHTGLLEKQDRLPTQGVHCEWQIDDILEYFLLGSGSLMFTFPGRPKPEILHNVLGVRKRREQLAEILSVIRVVDDGGV